MSKIYHVGLPPERAPEEFKSTIAKILEDLKNSMIAKGYDYHIVFVVPEDLESLKKRLTDDPPDGVVVGGGIFRQLTFMEQIVNVFHETLPKTAKIMFITKPDETPDVVKRWFHK
eukprot:Phypoly_transcript_23804.p1 GENE.Phypoly_transcript_23804~~Phypoly_transcript_23804.p1  ORF type:complete len:115 (+),score=22.16 Phypoly_transcript_23804:150-494(+)